MSTTLIETSNDEIVSLVREGAEAQQQSSQQLRLRKPASAKRRRNRDQRGLVTAEWAVGIIAAAGLAGVLIAVITSGPVQSTLLKVILHFISAVADKF